jgi:hypothetical protein
MTTMLTRHTLPLLLSLLIGGISHAAEPPKPHNGSQLIVVNDDGFSAFHSGRYKTAEDLRKAMLAFKDTQVAVMHRRSPS